MGIDYVIPHPCRNREELGEPGLRRWTFLFMIHKYLLEHPELSRRGLEAKEWQMPSYKGELSEPQSFNIADVREVGVAIGGRLRVCRDCQANLDPKAEEFGCVGRINTHSGQLRVPRRAPAVIDRRGVVVAPSQLILRTARPSMEPRCPPAGHRTARRQPPARAARTRGLSARATAFPPISCTPCSGFPRRSAGPATVARSPRLVSIVVSWPAPRPLGGRVVSSPQLPTPAVPLVHRPAAGLQLDAPLLIH
jgi:hypothetical protein